MRTMTLKNRLINGLRMFEFLKKRGVPVGKRPMGMHTDQAKINVFLPEITRLQTLAWHVREMLTRAFETWYKGFVAVDVMKEGTDVVVKLTRSNGTFRVVAVPANGTCGAKLYEVHDGSQTNWVPEQLWHDFAETITEMANIGDLEKQVCHPAVPPGLRWEVQVQGVFFEGLLAADRYITVRHYDGRPLEAAEGILPVETIRSGQMVDRCFLSSGRYPEAEITVSRDGTCWVQYRLPKVNVADCRLTLVDSQNPKLQPYVGDYRRTPYIFRDAAEQAYRAVAPVPDMADKIGEKMLEKLEKLETA